MNRRMILGMLLVMLMNAAVGCGSTSAYPEPETTAAATEAVETAGEETAIVALPKKTSELRKLPSVAAATEAPKETAKEETKEEKKDTSTESTKTSYLSKYYDYLSNNDWIYQNDGDGSTRRMAVLDMNQDGILEVIFTYEGTEWGNYTIGWLSYHDGLVVEKEDALRNDGMGEWVEYVNLAEGTFLTGRTRGKNIVGYYRHGTKGRNKERDSFALCYLDDEELAWDNARREEYNNIIAAMEAPVWVPINKKNLDTYLTGKGKQTGTDPYDTPYPVDALDEIYEPDDWYDEDCDEYEDYEDEVYEDYEEYEEYEEYDEGCGSDM